MSGTYRALTSSSVRTGLAKTGPSPATKLNPKPIASGTVRMSEKRMAASKPKRSTGCSVTSQAASGDLARARNEPRRARVALYSGR